MCVCSVTKTKRRQKKLFWVHVYFATCANNNYFLACKEFDQNENRFLVVLQDV
jgi:hypothetical protein